jgi:hypothetical protein
MALHETEANKIFNWNVVEYDSYSVINGQTLERRAASRAESATDHTI